MRVCRGSAGCLLAVVTVSAWTSAWSCGSSTCSTCSEEECNNHPDCYDSSPADYDPEYCITRELSSSETTIDPGLGCGAAENISISLMLGFMGGIFACLLPCCFCMNKSQQAYYKDFLDSSEIDVPATKARVTSKYIVYSTSTNSDGGTSSSTTPYFHVMFKARRRNGSVAQVTSRNAVTWQFYGMYEVGAQVDVRYNADNIREFVFPVNLQFIQLQQGSGCCSAMGFLFCFLSIFCTVGVVISGLAWPLTGCFVGAPFSIFMICGGVTCGMFVCLPLSQKLAQSSWNIQVLELQKDGPATDEAVDEAGAPAASQIGGDPSDENAAIEAGGEEEKVESDACVANV